MKIQRSLLMVFALAVATAALASEGHAPGHADGGSAIGEPGKSAEVTRTLQARMLDTMRFSPADFSVKEGETVRFVVKNTGLVPHEFVLGSRKELEAHAAMMRKSPAMTHTESNMLHPAPGATGELVWKFSKAGSVNVACLMPGHYEAGMRAQVRVAARAGAASVPSSQDGGHAH